MLVAVHIGAGHHAERLEDKYRLGGTRNTNDMRMPHPSSASEKRSSNGTVDISIFLLCAAMRDACCRAMAALQAGEGGVCAVAAAIIVLEVGFHGALILQTHWCFS